jgi:hypothetical protein
LVQFNKNPDPPLRNRQLLSHEKNSLCLCP